MTKQALAKHVKEALEGLFVVFYEIIGDRCNGSYLVRADNAAQAKKIVLKLDEDYVVRYAGQVQTAYDHFKDYVGIPAKINADVESSVLEELQHLLKDAPKKKGGAYQLECGT
jgi:malate/lactate dehydrogenase